MDLREGTVPEEKGWSIQTLRNKHIAIMDEMITNPGLSQNELAEKLGYSISRFSVIVNSPLFLYAFKQYRSEHSKKISDLAAEATAVALVFSQGVIENDNIDLKVRQESARDILSQGHARAVERKANLNLDVPVPVEALKGLEKVLSEMSGPFVPTRTLSVPPTNGEGAED